MRFQITTFALLVLAACNSPKTTQPMDENVVSAAREDASTPVPTAGGQPAINGEQGNIYNVEQLKPEQVVSNYGDLLHQRRFADAYAMWEPNSTTLTEKEFEKQFDGLKTIDAAVGKVGPSEGAAGSIYSTVQLTLSGNRKDGTAYVMTGPVTLRRVNDVPGSSAEQRQWHIVKMELTASPKAAETMLKG
jgi:hypothetical protein